MPAIRFQQNLGSESAVFSAASTGDKAVFTPGMLPFVIRSVAVTLNASPGDAGVIKFDKRPTAGSDSGRGDGDVAVLNLATTHSAGQVIYKDGLSVRIDPGEQVVAQVTDASAGVTAATVHMLIEYIQENPANDANMVATT